MKSIVIVTGVFPKRSETFVLQHALGLAIRGWDVTVLSLGVGDGIKSCEIEEIDRSGVTRIYLGHAPKGILNKALAILGNVLIRPTDLMYFLNKKKCAIAEILIALKCVKLIRGIDPVALHVHFGSHAVPLLQVGYCEKTIVTWHGYDANVTPIERGAGYYKRLSSGGYLNTVGSSFMLERLVDLGFARDSVSKIPMGVDLEAFSHVKRQFNRVGPFRIVTIGRLDEMKGHRYLIQACAKLLKMGHELSVSIVGEGPLRGELEQQIQELALEDAVKLLGAKTPEEVRAELRKADIFALTGVCASSGRVETQGVAVIEAQATGLPVVVSDVGGVADSFESGRTGILCEPENVDNVVEAIVNYIKFPDLRREHGLAARRFVMDKFSMDSMLDAFEELYQ